MVDGLTTECCIRQRLPVDEAAEPLVVGVIVRRDDVAADQAGLLLVAGVVGAVEREVLQRGELGLDPA